MKNNLNNVPTCELVEELKKRDGVNVEEVAPYDEYRIEGTGPVVVLVVED